MPSIQPQSGAFKALLQSFPEDEPVVMVNLLRFCAEAVYEQGASGGTGREAYRTYSTHTWPLLQGVGGEVLYDGDVAGVPIAPADEQWDQVLIVRYPSVAAFVSMVSSEAYGNIVHHRTAALTDSRLIATRARG